MVGSDGRRRVQSCGLRFVLVGVVLAGSGVALPGVSSGSASPLRTAAVPAVSTEPAPSPDADSSGARTEAEQAASERAQSSGQPVVVDALTTPTQLVTARPDGRFDAVLTVTPSRVKQAGSWVPVDTDLIVTSDGALAPVAAAVPVRFSRGGSGPMARVQGADGTWVELMAPFGGSLPAPAVDGNTATYRQVLPGVDLSVSATPVGLTQVLRIDSPEAAKNPALDEVSVPIRAASAGVTGRGGATGAVRGAGGSTVLEVGAAHWWDSSAPDAGVDGPGDAVGGRTVPSSLTAGALTIDVDSAADTPGVRFPIFVDPAWQSPTWMTCV